MSTAPLLSEPRDAIPPKDTSAGQPTVRIRGLSHYFGAGEVRKRVLWDNHLSLSPGEIVIMTGPSGSGKTTLLTLVGGLRSVQEGSVLVLGRELSGLGKKGLMEVRRGIGFIFQAHNLFEGLTAYQNVQLALELHARSRRDAGASITDMLTRLGLGHRVHYKPRALSGGQRQRVAIARALVNHPRLILADEPTAALDKESGRDVVNLLQQLAREEGCTIILVTHDNRILDVGDRIVNMVDGHITSNVVVKEALAICEFLRKCSVFTSFTPAALYGIAEQTLIERFPAGALVFQQGDSADKFYLIRRGSADVIIQEGESRRVVRTLVAGEHFGELALLSGQPRSATIQAREELELYALGKNEFDATIAANATLKEQLLKLFFQR
jgi:putative ABC transport system ATP-binding protein